jgi:hypothetical protein
LQSVPSGFLWITSAPARGSSSYSAKRSQCASPKSRSNLSGGVIYIIPKRKRPSDVPLERL